MLVRGHWSFVKESANNCWFHSRREINAELWCQPEQAVEQTVDLSVIWDAMKSCDVNVMAVGIVTYMVLLCGACVCVSVCDATYAHVKIILIGLPFV